MAGSRLPIAERSSNPGRRPVSHLPDLSVQNLETIPGWDQPRSAAPAQACRFGVRGRFDRQAVPSLSFGEPARRWSAGGIGRRRWNRPGEGVEGNVEPEFELVTEVVAGLEDVLGRHLDQVGVLTCGE